MTKTNELGSFPVPSYLPQRESENWPLVERDEIEAVSSVLKSGRLNYWTGEENRRFEEEFARKIGAQYAIALANGTLALELALLAIGLRPGDEVIVPARSFFATAACVVRMGGTPVFADVEIETQNISAEKVQRVVTPRTKAVICVHLAGHPCDLDPLLKLCERKGLRLIEDCAQAHGAKYRGRSVGAIGDIGCFSFCQDKIMTTGGEGGMLVTSNKSFWRSAWQYKDHGKSYEAVHQQKHPRGFRWLHAGFGSNFRLTEMQAAIGRRQLTKLDSWVKARRSNARIFHRALANVSGLSVPYEEDYAYHSFYKFYLFLEPELIGSEARFDLIDEINACGIPCISGACPEIYLEKAFNEHPSRPQDRLLNAQRLGETSLMLQVHPTLSEATMKYRASCLKQILTRELRHRG